MKILIAADDREYAKAIASTLTAQNYSGDLHFKVLNVVEPMAFRGLGGQTAEDGESGFGQGLLSHDLVTSIEEERERKARSIVLDIGTALRIKYPKALIEEAVVEDLDARKKIIDICNDWQADLVVMGSHGRSGLEKLFLGSVSLAVLAHVHCSVLVVKLPKPCLEDQAKLAEKPRSVKV